MEILIISIIVGSLIYLYLSLSLLEYINRTMKENASYEETPPPPPAQAAKPSKKPKKSVENPFVDDATDALIALGIKKTQAKKMVVAAIGGDAEMPLDEIVKKALASKKV